MGFLLALMLTASPDGGTVLHLGPGGFDLRPLGLPDAGPRQAEFLSWPELESALRNAGPLVVEIADDTPWGEVEKAGLQLGLAGRSNVVVRSNARASFSFDLDEALSVVIERKEVWISLAAEGCGSCRTAPWRRGDPPRTIAVQFAGRSLSPSVQVFEHVSPEARRRFDGPDGAWCMHPALRFKEVMRELEALHCDSCRIGLVRGPTAASVKATDGVQKQLMDLGVPQRGFGQATDGLPKQLKDLGLPRR